MADSRTLNGFSRRVVGHLSRRFDRPELLAAFDVDIARTHREDVAMRAILAALLEHDSVYVDVGANSGQILAHAVAAAPEGRHVAFEPIGAHVRELRLRFPGVDSRALAISDYPGESTFTHFRDLSGWSGLKRQPRISDELGNPETITVRVSTLDEQLDGIDPAVVKIDVEGAELGVLRGASRVIERSRPRLILEHGSESAALYGTGSPDLWDQLTEFGYRVYPVTGGRPVDRRAFGGGSKTVNWLAVPG
jgi:FkbM family methyltransferase